MLYSEKNEQSICSEFNVTRLGDITSLDTLGVPVWFACRPNSRSLSVSQGKGIQHDQARISALMECVEGAVAERAKNLVSKFGSIVELNRGCDEIVAFDDLARCRTDLMDVNRERAWVAGIDVQKNTKVFAPYEIVGLDYRINTLWDNNAFTPASIGMGAGPNLDFAIKHAMLELLEVDATCGFRQFGVKASGIHPLVVEQNVNSKLDEVIAQCSSIGLVPTFISVQSITNIPTIGAFISRALSVGQGMDNRMVGGFASRSKPSDAALAALLEAIQSRLTEIMGSRDDLGLADYLPSSEIHPKSSAFSLKELDAKFNSNLNWQNISAAISQATSSDVYVFDLPTGIENLHVVRVLAPGLAVEHGAISEVRISDIPNMSSQAGFVI